jgi:hypothetical protein
MAYFPPPRFEYRSCVRRDCPYSKDPHQHRTLVMENSDLYSEVHVLSPITSISDSSTEYELVRHLRPFENQRLAIANFAESSARRVGRRLESFSSSWSLRCRRRRVRMSSSESEIDAFTIDSNSNTVVDLPGMCRCWWYESITLNRSSLGTFLMIGSQEQDNEEATKLGSQRKSPLKPVEKYSNDTRMSSCKPPHYSLFDGPVSIEDLVVMQANLPDDLTHVKQQCPNPHIPSASATPVPKIRIFPATQEPLPSGSIQNGHLRQGERLRKRGLKILTKLKLRSGDKCPGPKETKRYDNSDGHLKTGHLKVPDGPSCITFHEPRVHDGNQCLTPKISEEKDIKPLRSRVKAKPNYQKTIKTPTPDVTDGQDVKPNGKHVPKKTKRNTSKWCPAFMKRGVEMLRRSKISAEPESENSIHKPEQAENAVSTDAKEIQVANTQQCALDTHPGRRVSEENVNCPASSTFSHSSDDSQSFWKGVGKRRVHAKLKNFWYGKSEGRRKTVAPISPRARANSPRGVRERRRAQRSNQPLPVKMAFRDSFSFGPTSPLNSTNGSCETERPASPRSCQPR